MGLMKIKDLRGQYVAIDFDGTCVTHAYPEVGQEIGAVSVLKRLVEEGAKLILWTMRSDGGRHGNALSDAVQWFGDHGIPLSGIQESPGQSKWTSSPKAYAKLYIDDAALGCPLKTQGANRPYVDWAEVERMIFD